MKKRYRILIIDDDSSTIQLLTTILEKAGYEVKGDTNPEAHYLLPHPCPDLILLDYYLGKVKGSEICRELKENASAKNIPVILMSSKENLYTSATEAHADDFLSKPFGIQELLGKIDFMLSDIEAIT